MRRLPRDGESEDAAGGAKPARPGRDVFTIRALARECGVTARTLRFYEEKGLLTPRRVGQERLYSRRDRARLTYVLMGKRVGFSLDEVRELLDLYDLDDGQDTQLRTALSRFGERIARLERQKREIEWIIDELRRASETVANMLEGRASAAKPRVRMRAARLTADEAVQHDPEKACPASDAGREPVFGEDPAPPRTRA